MVLQNPGLWADADPEEQIKWYEALGCNTIQTFAVSCNGYAWYKNGIVPEQPGLKYDFLTKMVEIGHKKEYESIWLFFVSARIISGRTTILIYATGWTVSRFLLRLNI